MIPDPVDVAVDALEAERAAVEQLRRAREATDDALLELRYRLATMRPAGADRVADAINTRTGTHMVSVKSVYERTRRAQTGAPRSRAGAEAAQRARRIATRFTTTEVPS